MAKIKSNHLSSMQNEEETICSTFFHHKSPTFSDALFKKIVIAIHGTKMDLQRFKINPPKYADEIANSEDTDQTTLGAALSDLALYCLLLLAVEKIQYTCYIGVNCSFCYLHRRNVLFDDKICNQWEQIKGSKSVDQGSRVFDIILSILNMVKNYQYHPKHLFEELLVQLNGPIELSLLI